MFGKYCDDILYDMLVNINLLLLPYCTRIIAINWTHFGNASLNEKENKVLYHILNMSVFMLQFFYI